MTNAVGRVCQGRTGWYHKVEVSPLDVDQSAPYSPGGYPGGYNKCVNVGN